jgi:hydrogenase nickel incorporation protein HypA/HybF
VHELSVCQHLLAQVADIAAVRGASTVRSITVELGPLCGVEPALLERAFQLARAGSCAAAAELEVQLTGIVVCCTLCGAETAAQPSRLVCGECGGYRTRLVSGDEMRLRAVELLLPS